MVGSGKDFAYDHLGEYLENEHLTTKDSLSKLDDFTLRMRANLDKLQEFVEYQLNKDVPDKLKHTSETIAKSLKQTET